MYPVSDSKLNLLKLFSLPILLSCAFSSGCADSPPDYPYKDQLRCEELDGFCTYDPALICPPGMQPYTSNDPKETNCVGQCCVEQEENNPCNPESEDTDDIASYNCVPDNNGYACPGNWAEVGGDVPCAEGRSCCYWRY